MEGSGPLSHWTPSLVHWALLVFPTPLPMLSRRLWQYFWVSQPGQNGGWWSVERPWAMMAITIFSLGPTSKCHFSWDCVYPSTSFPAFCDTNKRRKDIYSFCLFSEVLPFFKFSPCNFFLFLSSLSYLSLAEPWSFLELSDDQWKRLSEVWKPPPSLQTPPMFFNELWDTSFLCTHFYTSLLVFFE